MTIAEMSERIRRLKEIYPFTDEDTKIRLKADDRTCGKITAVELYTFDTDNDVEIYMTAYTRQN